MGYLDIDVSEVKRLVELVENYGLQELSVEEADVCITVKGRSAQAPAQAVVAATGQAGPVIHEHPHEEEPHPAIEIEPDLAIEGNIVDICAPLVGVFYRAPAPDAPAFVDVGDVIEVGSEVGLIEAMKVFSSIPSEVAGEVVAIPGENGKLVHEGEVLVRVKVSQEQNQ